MTVEILFEVNGDTQKFDFIITNYGNSI